jgi:hypothetical protein
MDNPTETRPWSVWGNLHRFLICVHSRFITVSLKPSSEEFGGFTWTAGFFVIHPNQGKV